MAHITDYKRDSMKAVLGSSLNNIDTLEIEYLQAAGATSNQVNNAWMEVFLANGATSSNWNNAANEFLIALGATGTGLPANWYWFWVTNGGVIGGGGIVMQAINDYQAPSATSHTIPLPAGVTAGEILTVDLLNDGSFDNETGSGIYTATGWTRTGHNGATTCDANCVAFWKLATGSETDVVVSLSPQQRSCVAWTRRFTGVHATTPIDVIGFPIGTNSTANPRDIPAVTTTVNGCYVMAGFSSSDAFAMQYAISQNGFVEEDEKNTGTGAFQSSGVIAWKVQETAGDTGICRVTTSVQAADKACIYMYALKPE